jgi:hypothetical protein
MKEEFIAYCLSFYGEGSKLDYFTDAGLKPMTRKEIESNMEELRRVLPSDFDADGNISNTDSLLREVMRDLVLVGRGEKPWGI